jgi:hypothetical protein
MTCNKCGKGLEIGDFPFCPHESIYPQHAQTFDPVVIHRNEAGEVRFPGRTDAQVPAGYEKVELRTLAEVRKFEREMNARDRAVHASAQERSRIQMEQLRLKERGELLQMMQQMSPFGRDLTRVAIQATDERARKEYDPGFRVEVFSDDASNREAHRDRETGWKERRR